jgi:hypothetical protein
MERKKPEATCGTSTTATAVTKSVTSSRERYGGDREAIQCQRVCVDWRGFWRIESARFVNVFDGTAAATGELNFLRMLAFVDEQYALLPFPGDHRQRVYIWVSRGRVSGEFHKFVSRAKIRVQQFQDPEAWVRFSGIPVDHGHGGKLRRISDQLRFSGYIDPEFCQLAE